MLTKGEECLEWQEERGMVSISYSSETRLQVVGAADSLTDLLFYKFPLGKETRGTQGGITPRNHMTKGM